jgi:formylglycine-generating enzyme required for sulfatase activity
MWYCGNRAGYGEPGWGCAPVGGKLPNLFGLHDMHGNLYEWCEDGCHEDYTAAPVDGSVWLGPPASTRIIRGGYWDYNAENCRSAYRGCYGQSTRLYHTGFRVVSAG